MGLVQKVLGNPDMRGLLPDDIFKLLQGGLSLRGIEGNEEQMKQAGAQQEIQNYYKGIQARAAAEKASREANSVKIEKPYELNGRMVQDTYDAQGKLISRVDAGTPDPKFASRVFEGPDGNLQYIPNGQPIPPGFKEPISRTLDMTEAQKDNRKLKLAGIEQMLSTMKDGKNQELTPEAVQGYADYFNKNTDAPYKFKMLPKDPGMPYNPLSGSPAQLIKYPNDPKARAKLPDEVLNRLLPVGGDGKQLTMEQVRKIAKSKGATIEEAIQLLIKD